MSSPSGSRARRSSSSRGSKRGGTSTSTPPPNVGDDLDFPFGVTCSYPDFGFEASAVIAHPIFDGPFTPVATEYIGNAFAHASLDGAATTIMENEGSDAVLAEGDPELQGRIVYGALTNPSFQLPQPDSQHLLQNIVAYVSGAEGGCLPDCDGDGDLTNSRLRVLSESVPGRRSGRGLRWRWRLDHSRLRVLPEGVPGRLPVGQHVGDESGGPCSTSGGRFSNAPGHCRYAAAMRRRPLFEALVCLLLGVVISIGVAWLANAAPRLARTSSTTYAWFEHDGHVWLVSRRSGAMATQYSVNVGFDDTDPAWDDRLDAMRRAIRPELSQRQVPSWALTARRLAGRQGIRLAVPVHDVQLGTACRGT